VKGKPPRQRDAQARWRCELKLGHERTVRGGREVKCSLSQTG
jgi:hypothetical protein